MEKIKINTVGVLGGLGPEASNKFCEYLIRCKPAEKDQDNINFIHYCNSKIPSRIDYISGKTSMSPIPEMVETCKALELMGADCVVVPCNTVHYLLPEVQRQVSVPIIDMIQLLVKQIKIENPNLKKIGVLGTTLTIDLKLYEKYFDLVGIEVVKINREYQENLVMDSIYQIKAGKKIRPRKLLIEAANMMISKGAEALVLGCTEIPLVLSKSHFEIPIYDPMNNCAKELVRYSEILDMEELFNHVVTPNEIIILRDVDNSGENLKAVCIFSEDESSKLKEINFEESIDA